MKMAKRVSLTGVHTGFLKQLKGAVQEYNEQTGKSVTFNDGFRTFEDQAAIYRKNPDSAAKPGSSTHEKGLAVDIASVDADAMEKLGLMKKYGLTRPVGG
jgi:D-alanyl-D-alanine dipeptidase